MSAASGGSTGGAGWQRGGAPGTSLAPPSIAEGTAWSPALLRRVIVAVAAIAGLVATVDGPQPTGGPLVDAVLVGFGVATITWLGASALRWDAVLVTLVAGLTSFSIVGTAAGVAAAAIGFVLPVMPGRRGLLNAVLVAIAMNIAVRSQLDAFLGASTLVTLALATYITVVGSRRRSRTDRRAIVIVGIAAGAVAAVATVALGVFGYLAADDLRAGNTQTEAGLSALGDGDITAARASFEEAAASFDGAAGLLSNPLVSAARFVPGLAQHHRVATGLSDEAADTARFLGDELDAVDLDQLTVVNGRIDVDQVRSLQAPLLAIQLRIEALQRTIAEIDSPWLLPPVSERVDDLANELTEQYQRSDDALTIALAAPGLLGGDEPRTYFIGFTTPSEARGSGGFMGNWAEMTVTDGQIEMTRFGRADDLNLAGDLASRRFSTGDGTGLDEWVVRYGPFNLASGPDGITGAEPWKNINMSPDIATTGRAIANLYPQSGGGQLDGIFIMDVYTLARFLEFTGPIPLPDGQTIDGQTIDGQNTVTAETAPAFLLHGQYDVTKLDARVDVLEGFSRTVIDTLLAGSLPEPSVLIDTLGPMVDQGRLVGWMSRPTEQAAIEQIGMSGTLPVLDGTADDPDDALAITFNNAAGNKIDFYLAADADYRVLADASSGTASATLTMSMTNAAPDNGEPGYVIGNLVGLPVGSNRTWVSVYSRLPVTDVTLDGAPVQFESHTEAGYRVTAAYVVLPPGATGTLVYTFAGDLETRDGYTLATRTPPTVAPTPLSVQIDWTDVDGAVRTARSQHDEPGSGVVSVLAAP